MEMIDEEQSSAGEEGRHDLSGSKMVSGPDAASKRMS